MTQSPVTQPQYSLEGVTLLKGLSADALKRAEESCSWRRYEPGERVPVLKRDDGELLL